MMTHEEALYRRMELLGRKPTQEEIDKAEAMDAEYGPILATRSEQTDSLEKIIAESIERVKKTVDKYATIC